LREKLLKTMHGAKEDGNVGRTAVFVGLIYGFGPLGRRVAARPPPRLRPAGCS
jgi:hypothetical protein